MAVANTGVLSVGKIESSLTINFVTGANTSVVTANTDNITGISVGDIISITGASGTEQSKLNGYWMIAFVSTGQFLFGIYTDDISSSPSKNRLTTGTYNTNLGTWKLLKKSSISIETGTFANTQTSFNSTNIRALANIVTPNSQIKFSDFYSKYLGAAYIYSNVGDEVGQRYFFLTDSLAPMSTTTGNPYEYISGTGNYEKGIFGGGYWPSADLFGNQRRVYTYATDIRTTSGTLSTARAYATSIGNATYGLFAGGKYTTTNLTSIDKYTYSSDTFSLESSKISTSLVNGCAVGDATYGLLTFGSITTLGPRDTRYCKYTYSTSGSVNSWFYDVYFNGYNAATSSGPTYGLIVGGNSGGGRGGSTSAYNSISKHVFGTSVSITELATTIGTAASYVGGSGNSTDGYFFNGVGSTGSNVLATRKYNYTTETLSNASTLVSVVYSMDATSSNPGSF